MEGFDGRLLLEVFTVLAADVLLQILLTRVIGYRIVAVGRHVFVMCD